MRVGGRRDKTSDLPSVWQFFMTRLCPGYRQPWSKAGFSAAI